jgi:hypothetical protein
MGEDSNLTLESNGLLDFFPTPPLSTENGNDNDELPQATTSVSGSKQKHSRPTYDYRFDDDDAPPPEYDEEPSDFEDEMMDIMEREQESILPTSSPKSKDINGMDEDTFSDRPLASCKSESVA